MLAILLLLAPDAMSTAALARDTPTERMAASHPYAAHVADTARRFGIPEAWIWAVMRVESNGDSRAVSSAGAMGLMQIMPATWANLRVRHGLGRDPYNVRDNIMAGAAYLRAMHDRYGNTAAMLAAYNAGPGRYDEYLARGRPLPAETRAYLAKLAPIIGSADDIQLATVAPFDPHAWRRAALFAARASDIAAASESVPDERPVDMHAAAEAPVNSLFVALSGRKQP
jgi:soluble lytic murein transglycosylase-like protein